jgi:uncharacterized membrane protein (DUF4010 family)
MSEYLDLFQRVMVAFSLGLLIGLERGWHERGAQEGQRVAGLRTFGLIALLGALAALLAEHHGGLVLGLAALGVVGMVLVPYALSYRENRERGITTEVAALLTFMLGAAAVSGYTSISVAAAVITALILSLKPQLHAWVASLEQDELQGAIKLLLISVVLLPVLPNHGYGPWGLLNPYQIWWLVVLIATIGFVGYFAMKLAGPRFGALLTGAFGGLVSSTAVALNFSRMGRANPRAQQALAAGIVVASATVFPRILIVVAVINLDLLRYLIPVVGGMTVTAVASGLWLWNAGRKEPEHNDAGENAQLRLPNPFELLPALQFGALLVAIMLASKASAEWFGAGGAYGVALLSGVAEVDAITLSMARLSGSGLETATAGVAIVIAAMTNTVAKGALVAAIGGRRMARPVGMAFGSIILTGIVILLVQASLAGF